MIIVSILVMILILTVLVVVHEWGHYIAARIFKIKVNEFSIFMGPKIFSRVGKKTGTVFSIRCLPLGGFCALEGEEKTENSDEAFCNKPWWQRTIVLLAGVFMNLVLAIVIITIIFLINGYTTREVSVVSEHLPISVVGLEPGDSIVDYNDYSVFNSMDFNLINYAVNLDKSNIVIEKANGTEEEYIFDRTISKNDDDKSGSSVIKISKISNDKTVFIADYIAKWQTNNLNVQINYADNTSKVYDFKADAEGNFSSTLVMTDKDGKTSESVPYTSEKVKSAMLGYSPTQFGFSFNYVEDGNIFECIGNAAVYNASLIKSVFNSIKWLITGRLGLDAMSGPIGITTVVDDVVTADVSLSSRILTLMEMGALISANLAAFNVLPIPGLDGGKLVFIIIELIRRGKKVPPEKEAIISFAFLALLILFSIFIAGNDIIRIIRS